MLRPTLAVAVLFTAPLAQADEKPPIPDGTWLLTTGGPVGDAPLCLLKTESGTARPPSPSWTPRRRSASP